MQTLKLPFTTLSVSRLGFGTASLHHAFRSQDRQALLGAAFEVGFTHFDTARMYGEGIAERELGRFFGKRRHQVTIATKFGIPAIPVFEQVPPLLYANRALGGIGRRLMPQRWNRRLRVISRESAEISLTHSLKALQTDWIDILFVHEPQVSDIGSLMGMADWLDRQKASGRVRYLGLAGTAAQCVEVARQTGKLFDVLQVEDTLGACEADAVTETGRPLQITFGYLRGTAAAYPRPDGLMVVQAALARNQHGMVLVSSRQPERLRALAALAA
jgi:aryl-alcohol dehydrogenase-like predicted oxidoreductase